VLPTVNTGTAGEAFVNISDRVGVNMISSDGHKNKQAFAAELLSQRLVEKAKQQASASMANQPEPAKFLEKCGEVWAKVRDSFELLRLGPISAQGVAHPIRPDDFAHYPDFTDWHQGDDTPLPAPTPSESPSKPKGRGRGGKAKQPALSLEASDKEV
jgi:hypothetical protein